MTVGELLDWLDKAEPMLRLPIREMEIDFQIAPDTMRNDNALVVPVAGASVQGGKVQLY